MSFIDIATGVIHFKVVYYGPALAGKTTNMQVVYDYTPPLHASKLISMAMQTDRNLFFDMKPPGRIRVNGLEARLHLYTLPGPVFYPQPRLDVLKDVDGVILVADSQAARMDANAASLAELRSNLAAHGIDMDKFPLVLQYNKRDLPTAVPVPALESLLNPAGRARFEAVAYRRRNVFETLHQAWRQVLARHDVEYLDGEKANRTAWIAPREPFQRPKPASGGSRSRGAAPPTRAGWLRRLLGRVWRT